MGTLPDYMPPFELLKTDHGIDGWDAKTWLVARFTTKPKAVAYLKSIGYGYQQFRDNYYADDIGHRNTMGAISYAIREKVPDVPIDPEPSSGKETT